MTNIQEELIDSTRCCSQQCNYQTRDDYPCKYREQEEEGTVDFIEIDASSVDYFESHHHSSGSISLKEKLECTSSIWYLPKLRRHEVERLLKDKPQGNFMLSQASDNKKEITLFYHEKDKTLEQQINIYSDGSCHLTNLSNKFESLISLLEYCITRSENIHQLSARLTLPKLISESTLDATQLNSLSNSLKQDFWRNEFYFATDLLAKVNRRQDSDEEDYDVVENCSSNDNKCYIVKAKSTANFRLEEEDDLSLDKATIAPHSKRKKKKKENQLIDFKKSSSSSNSSGASRTNVHYFDPRFTTYKNNDSNRTRPALSWPLSFLRSDSKSESVTTKTADEPSILIKSSNILGSLLASFLKQRNNKNNRADNLIKTVTMNGK